MTPLTLTFSGSTMVQQVDKLDEFNEIVGNETVTIIDFTATWCGPCKMIGPVFARLAESGVYGNITFIKVDVDVNKGASEKAEINCMPTFQVWKAGAKVEEFSGASEE